MREKTYAVDVLEARRLLSENLRVPPGLDVGCCCVWGGWRSGRLSCHLPVLC